MAQSDITTLLTKETPTDYFGVLSILFFFLIMLVSLPMMFFMDSTISLPISIALYASVCALEFKHKIYSPLSISLVVLLIGMYVLVLTDSPILPYSGTIIFGWLAVLNTFLILIKRPIHTFYSGDLDSSKIQNLNLILWSVTYVLAFAASLLLMPSIWYVLLPPILCAIASVLFIYLNFIDKSFFTYREKEFTRGGYTFRQVDPLSDQGMQVYRNYAGLLIQDEPECAHMEVEDLATQLQQEDSTRCKLLFGAYDGDRIIGSIAVSIGTDDTTLEIEDESEISFAPLRPLGIPVSYGRFGILKEYRERADVISGLMKCVLDFSFEQDASFVFQDVYVKHEFLYRHVGYTTLMERGHPRYFIVTSLGRTIPIFMNFAAGVFFKRDSVGKKFGLENDPSPLAERWVKRMVLRHMLSPVEKRPWLHTVESVRQILGITPAESK